MLPVKGLIPGSDDWVEAVKQHANGDDEKLVLCDALISLRARLKTSMEERRQLVQRMEKLMPVLNFAREELNRASRALTTAFDMTQQKEMPNGNQETN